MATGFVDRQKGKNTIPVGGQWIAGVQVNVTGADANTSVGWGAVPVSTISSATITLGSSRAAGIDTFNPNAGGTFVVQLANPFAGANKVLQYSTLNGSTGIVWACSTAAGVTIQGTNSTNIGGSSLTRVMKSTISGIVELLGVSSVAWVFAGVYPSTTGHITFSTST